MSKISKPFVIATEGQTIDGRTISREWIDQMAATYDPKVYTAVANIEHLLSLDPAGMFSAQGTVLSLGKQEGTLMGARKMQLTGVVQASDAVVAMQASGKKLFPSIEVLPNFAGSGKAYLTGLAFTDKPASLGTEAMKFSAGKDNVYSFGGEGVVVEFEDEKPTTGDTLFSKVIGYLSGKDKKDEDRFADAGKAITALAESQRALLDRFADMQGELTAATEKLAVAETAAAADRAAFTDLKAKLDAEPADPARPAAAGGNGFITTDC